MKYSKSYLNLYINLKDKINIDNIDKLSFKEISKLGLHFNVDDFNKYKKELFFEWFNHNKINNTKFIKKSKKIIKKLKIELNKNEIDIFDLLTIREFTSLRSLKLVEAPYSKLDIAIKNNLNPNVLFFYKDVFYFKKNKLFLRIKNKGELFISDKEMVIYDRENKKILNFIKYNNIDKIDLEPYSLVIKLKNNDLNYIKHYDNELIYISLKRAISNKFKISFNQNNKKTVDFKKTIFNLFI